MKSPLKMSREKSGMIWYQNGKGIITATREEMS